ETGSLRTHSLHCRGREILFAIAHDIVAFYVDLDVPIASWRRQGMRIVAQKILGSQFTIDPVEHFVELVHLVEYEHRPARAVGNRNQSVFSGSVASTLVFHWPYDDRVEQRP